MDYKQTTNKAKETLQHKSPDRAQRTCNIAPTLGADSRCTKTENRTRSQKQPKWSYWGRWPPRRIRWNGCRDHREVNNGLFGHKRASREFAYSLHGHDGTVRGLTGGLLAMAEPAESSRSLLGRDMADREFRNSVSSHNRGFMDTKVRKQRSRP